MKKKAGKAGRVSLYVCVPLCVCVCGGRTLSFYLFMDRADLCASHTAAARPGALLACFNWAHNLI